MVIILATVKSILATDNFDKGLQYYMLNFLITGEYFCWFNFGNNGKNLLVRGNELYKELEREYFLFLFLKSDILVPKLYN